MQKTKIALLLFIFMISKICLSNENLNCKHLLEIQKLRQELLLANKMDQTSGRPAAWVSNFIETRPKIDSSLVLGSSVISLGSGADIYLPLYLYPNAKNFILIDSMGDGRPGWGKGRDHVIEEIEARLQSLSPETQVERIDHLGNFVGPLPGPLVWRVHWKNSLRVQTKYFYLYQLDFEQAFHDVNGLAVELTSEKIRLGGIVVTGVPASYPVRQFLLHQLHRGGSMYTEMLFEDELGQTCTPYDRFILDELSKDFVIKDYGRSIIHQSVRFNPHQYLITPKN